MFIAYVVVTVLAAAGLAIVFLLLAMAVARPQINADLRPDRKLPEKN